MSGRFPFPLSLWAKYVWTVMNTGRLGQSSVCEEHLHTDTRSYSYIGAWAHRGPRHNAALSRSRSPTTLEPIYTLNAKTFPDPSTQLRTMTTVHTFTRTFRSGRSGCRCWRPVCCVVWGAVRPQQSSPPGPKSWSRRLNRSRSCGACSCMEL